MEFKFCGFTIVIPSALMRRKKKFQTKNCCQFVCRLLCGSINNNTFTTKVFNYYTNSKWRENVFDLIVSLDLLRQIRIKYAFDWVIRSTFVRMYLYHGAQLRMRIKSSLSAAPQNYWLRHTSPKMLQCDSCQRNAQNFQEFFYDLSSTSASSSSSMNESSEHGTNEPWKYSCALANAYIVRCIQIESNGCSTAAVHITHISIL